MTRTAVRLLFVAMLALLATQAAPVPVRDAVEYESVCKSEALQQQQARFELPRAFVRREPSQPLLLAEPDTVLLFQLPPPVFSLAS